MIIKVSKEILEDERKRKIKFLKETAIGSVIAGPIAGMFFWIIGVSAFSGAIKIGALISLACFTIMLIGANRH